MQLLDAVNKIGDLYPPTIDNMSNINDEGSVEEYILDYVNLDGTNLPINNKYIVGNESVEHSQEIATSNGDGTYNFTSPTTNDLVIDNTSQYWIFRTYWQKFAIPQIVQNQTSPLKAMVAAHGMALSLKINFWNLALSTIDPATTGLDAITIREVKSFVQHKVMNLSPRNAHIQLARFFQSSAPWSEFTVNSADIPDDIATARAAVQAVLLAFVKAFMEGAVTDLNTLIGEL